MVDPWFEWHSPTFLLVGNNKDIAINYRLHFFRSVLKQWSGVHMDSETGLAGCNHSLCSYWPVMQDKIHSPLCENIFYIVEVNMRHQHSKLKKSNECL